MTDRTDEMTEPPSSGRIFRARHRVRLGDVSPSGRMRLDAVARHLQDVATDDSRDAALVDADAWVVRRTSVLLRRSPVYQQELDVSTWCAAIGSHWALRRTRFTDAVSGTALVDTATVWVKIDGTTMRPARVGDGFRALYGESAGGRTMSARLVHDAPTAGGSGALAHSPWRLRFSDFDALGHVNNASGWEAVEEVMAAHRDLRPGPGVVLRAEVEHRRAIEPGAEVSMLTRRRAEGVDVWLTDRGLLDGEPGDRESVLLSARVRRADVAG